jgi:hypothetical protein
VIQAIPADCSSYIVSAGMNCYDFATAFNMPEEARDTAENNLHGFANGFSPALCDIINGFINNVNGMWLDILSAANVIIDAVKKALADPRKLATAVEKMVELANTVLARVRSITEFLIEIPETMGSFSLGQIIAAQEALENLVSALESQARIACEARKARILAKLAEKHDKESDSQRKQVLADKIIEIESIVCRDLVGVTSGSSLEWPEIPALVFGLGEVIQQIIEAVNIPLQGIRVTPAFSSGTENLVDASVVQSKLETVADVTNSKIDGVNNLFEPFVTSFNLVMELVQMLANSDLKGVLKWLLTLPKKIIDTYLEAAEFGTTFVIGLAAQNPLAALEDWAQEQYAGVAQRARERADAQDGASMDRSSFEDNFIGEIVVLFSTMLQGEDAVKVHVDAKVSMYGSIYGSIIELASQMYGALVGGFSYLLNVLVSDLAPLLSLMGMSVAIFAPPVNTSPNPEAPVIRQPLAGNEENFDTAYFQSMMGTMVRLDIDNTGAPISVDNAGYPIPIDPVTGIRPPDAERPVVPYGFFVTMSGTILYDSDGFLIRMNDNGNPDTYTLLPLMDPELLIRMNSEDITTWKNMTRTQESSGLLEVYNPDTGDYTTWFGTYTREIHTELTFLEIPLIGTPPENAQSSIDMSSYKVDGVGISDLTDDLSSPTSSEDAVQLYQGSFQYTRTLKYREYETEAGQNRFYNAAGRALVNETTLLERSIGAYTYSKINGAVQFRVETQDMYDGEVDAVRGIDEKRYPITPEVMPVFYYHGPNGDHYDNMGRIYAESGMMHRFGLFDNQDDVSVELRPAETGYTWEVYETPSGYQFTNRRNAGFMDILEGGFQFTAATSIATHTALYEGANNAELYFVNTYRQPTQASLHLKGPNDGSFTEISLEDINDYGTYWSAAIPTIAVSGTYTYYYTAVYGTASGYIGSIFDPFELNLT